MKKFLNIKGSLMDLSTPLVMGIINITPDSFFSGSRKNSEKEILERASQILEEGGTIIDLGGQSTSPSSVLLSAKEELNRLEPALKIVRKEFPDAILSVDTFYAEVAKSAVEKYGVDMINDISGGQIDKNIFATVAQLNVPYILMHMRGTPQTMHTKFFLFLPKR
jgi:dihydropteroate synthase